MPEDMPDRMPENMSDRMPEDLPVTKCINVMVGITRSKVFFFLLLLSKTLIRTWQIAVYGVAKLPSNFLTGQRATAGALRCCTGMTGNCGMLDGEQVLNHKR